MPKKAIYFIHGLGGSGRRTWKWFLELVDADEEICAIYDVFVFEYPTVLLRLPFMSKALRIQDLAGALRTQISNSRPHHSDVAIVAHSLGGLIARKYIIEEMKQRRPAPVAKLLLYGEPCLGSTLAGIADLISWRNGHLKQLCRHSDAVEGINNDWSTLRCAEHLAVKVVMGGNDRAVPPDSPRCGLYPWPPEILPTHGHSDMIQPDRRDDLRYAIFRNFLIDPPPRRTTSPSRARKPNIIPPPDLVDYVTYPWIPYYSYRYLESLDSTRFSNIIQYPGIRTLSAKAELVEMLLFGDGIILSENQLIDSRGAAEALCELVDAARKAHFKTLPIRFASRLPDQSAFQLASQSVGHIDEADLSRRFILSANPDLDLDIERRKKWADLLATVPERSKDTGGHTHYRVLDRIKDRATESEAAFVENWFTILDYVDNNHVTRQARNIQGRFSHEIEQILALRPDDLANMCHRQPDGHIPSIIHPPWFADSQEANDAAVLVSALQHVISTLPVTPAGRSPIYNELLKLQPTQPSLVEGIREVVDSVYNHTLGLAVDADSLSDSTGGDTLNRFVRVGHALSQWVRQTETVAGCGNVYELPWAWGQVGTLTWSSALQDEQIHAVLRSVPWEAILAAIQAPDWRASLAAYRTEMNTLQGVDRGYILGGLADKDWRRRHRDARKAVNECLLRHTELSARLISNQCWDLKPDGIHCRLDALPEHQSFIVQNYRNMGTAADYENELVAFRTDIVRLERSIFSMISQVARKRQVQ